MVLLRLKANDHLRMEKVVFQARVEPMHPASVVDVELFVVHLLLDFLEVILGANSRTALDHQMGLLLVPVDLVVLRKLLHRVLPDWTSDLIRLVVRSHDVERLNEYHYLRKSH